MIANHLFLLFIDYIMAPQQQQQIKDLEKEMQQPRFLQTKQYDKGMIGRRLVIVGLAGPKGQSLNGKVGSYQGVQYQAPIRTLIKVQGDSTIYKIRPRNLVPQGYTLKTIHYPYEVMTINEEQAVDKLIGAAQKNEIKPKEWKLCFKYVNPQTNYCFTCHQFGTACYDYCAYCGSDYLRLLHVEKQKLMIFYKRCIQCTTRELDLNLQGVCYKCWEHKWEKPLLEVWKEDPNKLVIDHTGLKDV